MSHRVWWLLLLVLFPVASTALPVTYEFSAGNLTSVRLDATTGEPTDCPIQSTTSCLANGTIELMGSIVYDDETGLISNLEFSLVDTALLDLGSGIGDMQQIYLADLSYDSGGTPAFVTMFGFQVLGGALTTTLALDDGSGNLAVVPDEEITTATLSIVQVDESTLEMDLSSAAIATVCDPSDPDTCAVLEADFNLTAQVAPLSVGISTSDGISTLQSSIVVSGTVNQGDATVDVEGVAATVSGLTWTANVPLMAGSNLIRATATRGAESATDQITILQLASNPPAPPVPVPNTLDPTTVTRVRK